MSAVKPPPVPDWVVVGSALEMIRQHGDDAATWAAMRADQLLEKGDVDGHRTWCRVLARIEHLAQDGGGTLQ